ncbi:MAG: DNA polymerase domain-containing protein [Nitrososphaerales archaeon]
MFQGRLLDCYPSKEGMTFWLKSRDGQIIKFHDRVWRNRIYAAGEAASDAHYLHSMIGKTPASHLVSSVKGTYKRANVLNEGVEKVIEIELARADGAKKVADALEGIFQNPLALQLYNVDVLPEQNYFYEKNIFPLASVEVGTSGDEIQRWDLKDDVESLDYEMPNLNVLTLGIEISDPVPRFDSRLLGIAIQGSEGKIKIDGRNEAQILEESRRIMNEIDPDIIITSKGDLFGFPFLNSKAQKLRVDFNLNRDAHVLPSHLSSNQIGGTTYFSYGRILFKARMQRLYGRIHFDESNTFVYDQCKFAGLYEVTRLCRMPLHTSARASIGKCLSSLQFYYASKRDILIPWKPWISEDPKTFHELLIQDRGGLVLEPLPGIHEHVGEIDFASLYPSIIQRYNISAETVNCSCCKETGYTIEGLDMHVCKLQQGIVAESLKLPLQKRFEYRSMRDSTNDKSLKQIYNERAGALKWILVCCFGYLSYRNAKFGKIDSHIAVCGYARKTLLQAMRLAEQKDYRVMHGIVDSLWLSKASARRENYEELCDAIRAETGFKIVLEGIYRWIVFLPSKLDRNSQVANRYFGCFDTGEIKARGIELRRRDTPVIFKQCQTRILTALSECIDVEELRKKAQTDAIQIFNEFASRLERHDVPATDLLITRRLSKNLEEYNSQRQLSVNASSKLEQKGLKLQAGQSVSYVITNYKTSGKNRAVPEGLVENTTYDSRRYVELLADCCATILSPFGVSKQNLLSRSQSLA